MIEDVLPPPGTSCAILAKGCCHTVPLRIAALLFDRLLIPPRSIYAHWHGQRSNMHPEYWESMWSDPPPPGIGFFNPGVWREYEADIRFDAHNAYHYDSMLPLNYGLLAARYADLGIPLWVVATCELLPPSRCPHDHLSVVRDAMERLPVADLERLSWEQVEELRAGGNTLGRFRGVWPFGPHAARARSKAAPRWPIPGSLAAYDRLLADAGVVLPDEPDESAEPGEPGEPGEPAGAEPAPAGPRHLELVPRRPDTNAEAQADENRPPDSPGERGAPPRSRPRPVPPPPGPDRPGPARRPEGC